MFQLKDISPLSYPALGQLGKKKVEDRDDLSPKALNYQCCGLQQFSRVEALGEALLGHKFEGRLCEVKRRAG